MVGMVPFCFFSPGHFVTLAGQDGPFLFFNTLLGTNDNGCATTFFSPLSRFFLLSDADSLVF